MIQSFHLITQKYLVSEDNKAKENYLKDFRNDIRKRIDEVAKYINIKNKISSAVMFIPSEEIFAFLYAHNLLMILLNMLLRNAFELLLLPLYLLFYLPLIKIVKTLILIKI